MAAENKAQIWAVMGQSGTGKGLWVKSELRRLRPARILILDPQDEYGALAQAVASASAMVKAVAAAGANGPYRLRYVFPKDCTADHFKEIFDLACQLAYMSRNCVFLVEELSNFTTASYAPPLWRRMCNSGRHEGVHVIGCSQFPAQVDKSFLGNATMIHCGWLGELAHRKVIAMKMDVDEARIKGLPDLHFLEWHRDGRRLVQGEVSISGRVTERPVAANDDAGSAKTTTRPAKNLTKRP